MKKLLMILALGAFVACNDSSTTTEEATEKIDSSADARIDSLDEKTDLLTDKIDSTRDARIDTLKSN